jgi:hypothetical protein
MKLGEKGAFIGICAAAVAVGIMTVGTMSLLDARNANAKPEFAAQTGLPCGKCHQNPAGGGPRKPFGDKFKENGFKVK